MPDRDISGVVFRKSTHSDGGEGCVEAATLNGSRLVRDSKDPDGPTLAFTPSAWAVLIEGIKQGKFNLD
ncbi:DUF397 domain-containing protein [Actinoallomurus sp. NBC_01490]|jgi:hypothetical protein|uniref:DUF397 domain-containing protein n=1 Tax=Actinoallomurus sp. NBC_01490 TaxID=2903557 RepID=UPI002E3371E6|nr:DUF397 domain-containing protein [Actinoallomurus sp. NBC_01490]